jgi:transposase
VPGQAAAASLIVRLAQTVLDLDRQLADLDREVAPSFRTHDDAAIITSLTGIGGVLGAEFLSVVGGSLAGFASADHLAGYAASHPRRATPATAPATCTGRSATTGNSSASSTPRP